MASKSHCNMIPSKNATGIGTPNFGLAHVVSRQMNSLILTLYCSKKIEKLFLTAYNCRMNNLREGRRDWKTINEAGMIRRAYEKARGTSNFCCLKFSLRGCFVIVVNPTSRLCRLH